MIIVSITQTPTGCGKMLHQTLITVTFWSNIRVSDHPIQKVAHVTCMLLGMHMHVTGHAHACYWACTCMFV